MLMREGNDRIKSTSIRLTLKGVSATGKLKENFNQYNHKESERG